jgi:N-acetylmuramoyl-L-alanine amidase
MLGIGSLAAGGAPGSGATPGSVGSPLPVAPATGVVVCIDPGHPSETSDGTKASDGTTEISVAWQVALRMRPLLAERGVTVVLTKQAEGQMVTNRRRAEIANEARAALMVRLHCDAAAGSGFALYAPDRQGTTQGVTGPRAEVIRSSTAAAAAMRGEMAPLLAGSLRDGGVRGDSRTAVGARQGALTGSIFSQVPVVTVEMAVLTNDKDAAFITGAAGQDRMARAMAAGILVAIRRAS